METHDQRVGFSLTRGDVSVSANVSVEFFDAKILPTVEALVSEIAGGASTSRGSTVGSKAGPQTVDMSVKMIAHKLGASKGSDVIKAGAISLALANGKPQFSRKDLLEEAQKAVGYWKKNMASNATKYIKTLLGSDFLIESSSGQLSLSAAGEIEANKALVANI